MNIKKFASSQRDNIQQGIYKIINPFVRFLIRCGVTPNMVTTIGCLGQLLAAAVLVWAGIRAADEGSVPFNLVTLSGVLIIAFAIFDMLDGQVARLGNMTTRFGAMYDSILDRYCELFMLGGIMFYFICIRLFTPAIITFFAVIGSLLVSYVRARAEGVGIECKIGFMQRPERVVVCTLGVLLCGIVGQVTTPNQLGTLAPANIILIVAMTIIAVFSNITAIARINHCRKELQKLDNKDKATDNLKHSNRPTLRETVICLLVLAAWLCITVFLIGLRPEHIAIAILVFVLFFAAIPTRRLVVALLPFIIFAISYDFMNLIPNYAVNTVDIAGIYNLEKTLFGIDTANGVLTPNEFLALYTSRVPDILAGVFYLCWVPLPIFYGLWLYFSGKTKGYLHFALVFLFVNLIGFSIYYIHPASPPWYVASYGYEFHYGTPGEVAGLGAFDKITGLGIFNALYTRNSNVFAALPSLHSAYTFLAFIYSIRNRNSMTWRTILGVVTVGIWLTAVYTSHHYVLDVLAGIGVTLLAYVIFEYLLMRIPAFSRFMSRYANYISKNPL